MALGDAYTRLNSRLFGAFASFLLAFRGLEPQQAFVFRTKNARKASIFIAG
jgi:hypothetical protein